MEWIRVAVMSTALLVTAGYCCSCGDDDESTRPETFGNPCESDTDCRAPFRCLSVEDAMRCSTSCTDTSDCPSWHEGGHCTGDRQSQCLDSVCTAMLCK